MKTRIIRYTVAIMAAVFFVAFWNYWQSSHVGFSAFSFQRFSLITFLFAVVLFPICEEVIFRGVLQAELSQRIPSSYSQYCSLSTANWITSTVFALGHAMYFSNPIALLVFFPSLVFGYMYDKERTLLAPIIIHASYNLIALLGAPVF